MTTIQDAQSALDSHFNQPIKTLADLADHLRTSHPDLPARARQDMLAALTTVARAAAKPLAGLKVEPEALRSLLSKLSPVMAGVSDGRWRNMRSLLRKAISLTTDSRGVGVYRNVRTPAWMACLATLPDAETRRRLSRLTGFCTSEGIEPKQVDDGVLGRFLATLRADPLTNDPHRIHREAIKVWNVQAGVADGWPATVLTLPDRRNQYGLPLETFPASLQAEVQAWERRLAGTDLIDEYDFEPLRPSSIRTRTKQLRLLLSAMVRSGTDPNTLQSFQDVVVPERVAAALTFIKGRAGSEWGLHTGQMAGLACSLARHHADVGPEQLRRLTRLKRKVTPKISGMTERNQERLRALDDPAKLLALVSLSPRLCREARRGGKPSIARARLLRGAVAAEILLMAPIRLSNLRSLEVGRQVLVDSQGMVTIALSARETKNSQPFEGTLPPSSARMITTYMRSFQPLLCEKASAFLFPNAGGDGPMSEDGLRSQIQTLALKRAGLVLHPHLYRHIAGKVILDRNPGAYGRVRLTLGHRFSRTTETYYAGTETRAALALYGRDVLALRRELGMSEDDRQPPKGGRDRRGGGQP